MKGSYIINSNLLQLLIDHEDAVAPDPNDPLRIILKDLGPSPSIESLIGKWVWHITCT